MNKTLAIIILNYFGHEHTLACVASVRCCVEEIALFIVDNSTDIEEETRLRELFEGTPDVRLLFPGSNLGFAAGVNWGLSRAMSEGYSRFLLLNNDAVLLDGAGAILQAASAGHPGALMAPTIRWAGQVCAGNYYHRYLGLIIRKRPRCHSGWLFYLTGCGLLFDRVFLEQNGPFNEAFFMYGEDVEFCSRAYGNGLPVLCLPDIIIDHVGSGSAQMASFFYEYHVVRSHYLLTFILLPHPLQRALSLAGKFLCLMLRALVRCLRFKTVAPLKALCLAPIKLPVRPP